MSPCTLASCFLPELLKLLTLRKTISKIELKMATAIHHQRYVIISDPPNGISNGTESGNANGNCQCKLDTHTVGPVANGNGNHSNGIDQSPLNIAIVGAGIGGLTAAIGLRRNGHNVTVGYIQYSAPPVSHNLDSYMNNRDLQMKSEPLFT